jgi:hypothetical protein
VTCGHDLDNRAALLPIPNEKFEGKSRKRRVLTRDRSIWLTLAIPALTAHLKHQEFRCPLHRAILSVGLVQKIGQVRLLSRLSNHAAKGRIRDWEHLRRFLMRLLCADLAWSASRSREPQDYRSGGK